VSSEKVAKHVMRKRYGGRERSQGKARYINWG
jgi:hypothetical protein